jgi:hypothetical protein
VTKISAGNWQILHFNLEIRRPSFIIEYAGNTGKFLVYQRKSRGTYKEFLIKL